MNILNLTITATADQLSHILWLGFLGFALSMLITPLAAGVLGLIVFLLGNQGG